MTALIQHAVASELRRYQLSVEPQLLLQLAGYLELLERWGHRMNLTGRPQAQVVARRLLPDALVLTQTLPAEPQAVVDVGSGNGIIGLVLGLLRPGHRMLLVEPSQRRCSFLRTAIHQLQLSQVTIAESRLEQLQLSPMDVALSRATWPTGAWLDRGAGLVREEGLVVAFLTGAAAPPQHPELGLERTVPYLLADGTTRQLVLYRRFT